MNSPNYFIITPKGERYNNTKKIGDTEILVNNNIEDGHKTNREGIVVATPMGYNGDVEVGDTIIVHHNTFRLMRNQRGVLVNSAKHIKDNLFYADTYYLRIDKEGNKYSANPYVFLKPIVIDDFIHGYKEHDNIGEVVFTNSKLEDIGITKGNKYLFKNYRNVRYDIDGETYYRMKFDDLVAEI